MNRSCQNVSEVILLVDDDEEEDKDVKIVFSNLNNSTAKGFQYELIKISEEIKLLQAMCKQSVPRDFCQFKENAQKLGNHFSFDVVQSAWQRLVKKSNIFPNNVVPVCRVKPQTAVISPLQDNDSNSTSPSSSSRLGQTDKIVAPTLHISSSNECIAINDEPLDIECFDIRENITSFSSPLIENLDEISNSAGYSSPLSNGECDSEIVEPNRLCENEEVTKNSSALDCGSTNKQHVSINLKQLEEVSTDTGNTISKLRNFRKTKCFKKKKKETVVPGPILGDCNLETNLSDESSKKRNSQLKKGSPKKLKLPLNSSKPAVQPIAKSHVGVKAKIVKRKSTVTLSETELKEFKKEQKRLKYQQKCELELQQLQKVHDRLVDVLIPKYYKTNRNTNN